MLISTSRKPSQKTRLLCKNLSNAFGYKYINRGKMSMRDLCLKSSEFNKNLIFLLYETKGNPSKITFLSNDGEEKLSLLISAKSTKSYININHDQLKFKSDNKRFDIVGDILSLEKGKSSYTNYINIRSSNKNNNIAIIDFYNNEGSKLDLEIAIKKIINKEL
jgi:U3 small nucleolar ribonucleoprotein protein IMP4